MEQWGHHLLFTDCYLFYLMNIAEKISLAESLYSKFINISDLKDRIPLLLASQEVERYLSDHPKVQKLFSSLSAPQAYALYTIIALKQAPFVFAGLEKTSHPAAQLTKLAKELLEVEEFYNNSGGIVGYYLTILKLIYHKYHDKQENDLSISYLDPEAINIEIENSQVREYIRKGIEYLPHSAEIYPVGGAGDRLNLTDHRTGESLPAACLPFCGRTLFEGLIRDLQGREFLYYKLFGIQKVVPVAIMTSHEKENHKWILDICESNQWFGRPRDSYKFFVQNLVPVMTVDGDFAMKEPLEMYRKPSGHGVIWKMAEDAGVFTWLKEKKCRKAIVRQINNPIAATDYGLCALLGYGSTHDKLFGFASCPRRVGSSEGMDVLCERKEGNRYGYNITNVEYTEFQEKGIKDAPEKPGSSFSKYPANTNILFVDLATVQKAAMDNPIPGKLINMKSTIACYTSDGIVEKKAGRLESTMQNIADDLIDWFDHPLKTGKGDYLSTFLLYNKREKTISVTKNAYKEGNGNGDTPEHCFFEVVKNYHDLLKNYCQFTLPDVGTVEEYLENGPPLVAHFHPALGGLYSVIAQKIRRGKMAQGSELILEISEVDIADLELEGSLIVEAENVMGILTHEGELRFAESKCGKCTLNKVRVKNRGVEHKTVHEHWQCQANRFETARILIHGNGEFYAEDVDFEGEIYFEVPDGYRLVVYSKAGEMAWHYEPLEATTWEWDYRFDGEHRIVLTKVQPV